MAEVTLINRNTMQSSEPLRVCAYCRVSRSTADQLNSYARQIHVYTQMIQKHSDWTMVEIFADEGITGTSAYKRPKFQRMIRMCEMHQIDLIITKSVSRFGRNVKETLEFVRKLKILGVAVQFEKEGINTLSMGDEMLLNTFAAIAEEESVEIAIRLRNANKKRMADGDFIDGNAPYGFRLVDRKLVEYEPEANVVRAIFSAYLDGMSTFEIAKDLNRQGIPSKENTLWQATAIKYILKNEKYKGDFLCQKTYHTDVLPFRQRRNHGEEDQFYVEGAHDPIVDPETFDRANELLTARREKIKTDAEPQTYLFTGMIRCSECGAAYNRKKSNGGIYWVCVRHLEARELCDSHYIREERIQEAFTVMVNRLRFAESRILKTMIRSLENAIDTVRRNNEEAYNLSVQISDINSKLLMLEQLNSKGYLAAEIYHAQAQELTNQLAKLKESRTQSLGTALTDKLKGVSEVCDVIDGIEKPLETFNPELFTAIVEHMEIDRKDTVTFTLHGGMRFTEVL